MLTRLAIISMTLAIIPIAANAQGFSASGQEEDESNLSRVDSKRFPGSFGAELFIGGGDSENLSVTRPPNNLAFRAGNFVLGYQIRLRGYIRSMGALLIFERYSGGKKVGDWSHGANSAALLIAASHHQSILHNRLRLEAFYGLGHTRDAARVRQVVESGYDYKYDEWLSEVGAAFGADVLIRPVSAVALHGMFVRNAPGKDHDRLKLELLIRLASDEDGAEGYLPERTEISLILSYLRAWKENRREDGVVFVGLSVGNWAWR